MLIIVQARMGSKRLPGKVLKSINGQPVLELVVNRLAKVKSAEKIVIATTANNEDDVVEDFCSKRNLSCFRGSENNVLERFYLAAKQFKAKNIIRITADCPLIDHKLIEEAITVFYSKKVDYLSNTNPPTFPDGYDFEIMTFDALEKAYNEANDDQEKEHVTIFIRKNTKFKQFNYVAKLNLSHLRLTLDNNDDLKLIKNIYKRFDSDLCFGLDRIQDLYENDPNFFNINLNHKRNEGMKINSGQKLYARAKNVISGGNMLLSKRPEMYLPDYWPAYFSKSKGSRVWDLDNNEFIDMASMGIGTNILGYCHPEVEEAVIKVVKDGNMTTLNCPEEVYLAEKLIDLHQWSGMAKFARSGGEANAISIRIARAYTNKDKILVCGYHGWHDWYLAMNLDGSNELKKHLLDGLSSTGIPKALNETVLGFEYNNFEELEQLVKENNGKVAAIKMEVQRNQEPQDNFLQKVRELATENNILLIFDECTSGFRETNGGLHKKFNVYPDLAVFGKALGNGHAITCVLGNEKVMQSAQSSFISSTFWTERIGPAAALKTLEIMSREKSWEKITIQGKLIQENWLKIAQESELKIELFGIPSLCGFNFVSNKNLAYKTYITQEMLKKGFLCSNIIYSSIAHSPEDINNYFRKLSPIFHRIREFENDQDKNDFLEGPVCHSGFKRLN